MQFRHRIRSGPNAASDDRTASREAETSPQAGTVHSCLAVAATMITIVLGVIQIRDPNKGLGDGWTVVVLLVVVVPVVIYLLAGVLSEARGIVPSVRRIGAAASSLTAITLLRRKRLRMG